MKMGFKYATHVWLYHLLMIFIGLLFVGGVTNTVLSIIMNVMLLLGVMAMAFNEGSYSGEKACTLAVSLEKQLKEGRRIDEKLKAQVYDRKVAAWIMIFGAAPLLLLSTINVIVAPLYPEPVAVIEEAEDAVGSFAFDYDDEKQEETVPINVVNVISRIVFMPFVTVYNMVSSSVLNALFFLFSLPMPLMEAIGYLNGPKMREKKLKDIARGKKRKMRNLKVNKKPRQQKAEV